MNDRYHIAIKITEEQKWLLKQEAVRERKSVSKLVTELVLRRLGIAKVGSNNRTG